MCAARWKSDGVAELLIEAGANVDATDKVRLVGMQMCMRGGCIRPVRPLI